MWYNTNMIERVRDFKRNFRPQAHLSFEEWEDITDKYAYAKKFMSDANPVYMKMKVQLKKFEDDILENKLKEEHKFNFDFNMGVVKEMFVTPKKIQDDETIGKIKYLRDFFAELDFWIWNKEDHEKKEADGEIAIEHEKR